MSTPSRCSNGARSRLMPKGEITVTCAPERVSVCASCHTRRSLGTEKFSSRMSTRRATEGLESWPATRANLDDRAQAWPIQRFRLDYRDFHVRHYRRDPDRRQAAPRDCG